MSYKEFLQRYNLTDCRESRQEYRMWLACMEG